MKCWVEERLSGVGPCDGRLVKAHLIPKQRIKRELRQRVGRAALDRVVWDPRCWVWMCGGPMGNAGHHGRVDARSLRIPRGLLPAAVEEYALEHGLVWSLDADYGRS